MRCHPYFIENDDSGQLGGVLRVNGLRENNKINESLEETNNRNDLNWAKNCDVPWGISKPNSKLVLVCLLLPTSGEAFFYPLLSQLQEKQVLLMLALEVPMSADLSSGVFSAILVSNNLRLQKCYVHFCI